MDGVALAVCARRGQLFLGGIGAVHVCRQAALAEADVVILHQYEFGHQLVLVT